MSQELNTATFHRPAVSSSQRDEALQQLHIELYKILAEILRVCNILGLHPFLQGGSAIGAFFDKGIIPWDDDIDVGLIRDEYEIFIEKGPSIINPEFFIQCCRTEPNMFMASLLKVRRNNTFFWEEVWNDVPLHHGIFVDIMPYDKVPDNICLQKVQRFILRKLENVISHKAIWKYWLKRKFMTDSLPNFTYCFKSCLWATLFSKQWAIRAYKRVSCIFNKRNCTYYNQAKQSRDHIAVTSIEHLKKVPFGPLEVCIPGDVETYLHHHYPNLRPTLPENERESHMPHRIEFSDGTSYIF